MLAQLGRVERLEPNFESKYLFFARAPTSHFCNIHLHFFDVNILT